ncbi:MAG TPA: hypothetical protein PK743_07720 [Luteimonas sp.]|nr:hypothetical protein [Luteimonas sp.]HRO28330.1 hypothetical protein [Luteimonas sp.]HRP72502.1 hypothetical protein [Luteimonas sp.]
MNAHRLPLALALALLAGSAAAATPSPAQTGALPVPANAIAGYWQVRVSIGPCGSPAANTFLGLNTFHAGGTVSDTNTFAPGSRGPGMGVWVYLGRGHNGTMRYRNHFQFARFLPDGSFDGLQDVRNEITLQPGGNTWTGVTNARVLNADGSVRMLACGSGLATRVGVD